VYVSHHGNRMDVISNMLITIKNGGLRGKKSVHVPFSSFKTSIAKALLDTGYIAGYEKKDRNKGGNIIEVNLAYSEPADKPRITQVKRISKPSRRLYAGAKDIYEVKQGRGDVFLSTPKGVMTGKQAREGHTGGEILFEIW